MPSKSELLTGLDEPTTQAVLGLGSRVTLPAHSQLFRLGESADNLFLIARGSVSLTLPMQVNEETADLLVEEKTAGQVVGWSAVIPPHRFTLEARTRTECELISIPRRGLADYFAENPAAGYALTRNIAAIVGGRLQVFQAMWLRQLQRVLELHQVVEA
jgi:CRP-like cAMP-binding protein